MRILFGYPIDPNDKVGPGGYCDTTVSPPITYVYGDKPYQYTIYFENVDSAVVEAENVIITDTLDPNLDWATFEFGEIFPGAGPDSIRPNFNVSQNFDTSSGIVTWYLNNIMLPPDTAPYWGEGWVSYTIWPRPQLSTGTSIENIAAIKFDDNPWILAPMDSVPISITIDADPPTSQVHAFSDTTKPAIPFMVSWGGNDLGAGIVSYRIYMADSVEALPGNNFVLWLTTPGTSAMFEEPQSGHIYSFYCVATDGVGHNETKRDTAEARIKIIGSPCSYILGDINGDGNRIGSDVTYGVRYFKGMGLQPPDSCYLDSTGSYLYVAGDVNGNCEFRGSDITRLVTFFKGNAQLAYCHFFPPLPYLLASPDETAPLILDNAIHQPSRTLAPVGAEPKTIQRPEKRIEPTPLPVDENHLIIRKEKIMGE